MRKFEKLGQRVHVRRVRSRLNGEMIAIDVPGEVVRLRRLDDGAIVDLDVRLPTAGVHAFPRGDTRECHVIVQPEDCDPVADRSAN